MAEEEPLRPLAVGKTRVQVLQEENSTLRGMIMAASDDITRYNDQLLDPKEEALHPELKAAILTLQEQQAILKALLKSSQDELTKLEGVIMFAGKAEVRALIGPELDKNSLPKLDQLAARLDANLPANFPLDVNTFAELKSMYNDVGEGSNAVEFFVKSQRTFPPSQLSMNWLVRDYRRDVQGKNEDCVHVAIAPPIQYLLDYFLREAGAQPEYSRNKTEDSNKRLKTTSGANRPDFLLYVKKLIRILRGGKEAGCFNFFRSY